MTMLTHTTYFTASHTEPLLPGWHPCCKMHAVEGKEWTATLQAGEDDPAAPETERWADAFDGFDAWVAETLNHRHLNEIDPALREHSGPDDLARWIYETWRDRLPRLAAVQVSVPPQLTGVVGWPGPRRSTWLEYVYPPAVNADTVSAECDE